jgi:thioredoxin-dependent peroxiredoxin
MQPLQAGDTAPRFQLPNQDGTMTDLKDFLGRFVVIYFYPKALTSGCTTQACGIRDRWDVLQSKGISVIGISPDPLKLLKKFKDAEDLPFDLLSDSDHVAANLYGTWVEKSMYGRKYMGMARDSFIISPEGTIITVLHKVQPGAHVDLILKSLNHS